MAAPEIVGQAAKVFSHPACARDATTWLDRIATSNEADRTQRMLDSLTAAHLQATGEIDADNSKSFRQREGAGVPARGGEGWTYTATSRALTTSPAPANNGAATRTARGDAADHPGTILGGGTWQAEERSSLPAGGGARAALFSARRSGSGRPTPEPTAAPTHHDPHREIDTLMTAAAQRAGAAAAANAATEALRRRARPTSPSMAAHGPGAGAGSAPHMPPEVTTYQMAFHLAQMHPELYAQALAAGKADRPPNYTLTSEWGDSLRAAAAQDGEWRAKFFRSMYDATNREVYPAQGVEAAGSMEAAKEEAFFKWMARQQTYYRELLKDGGPRGEVDTLLAGVPLERKREALEVLRQLTAVARPDMLISHSQAEHNHKVRAEDDETTALMRQQTRDRTMGRPPPRVEGTYKTFDDKMRDREVINAMRAATGAHVGGDGMVAGRPASAPFSSGNRPRTVEVRFGSGRERPASSEASGRPRRPHTPGVPLLGRPPAAPAAHNSNGLRPLTALATRQAEALNASGPGAVGGLAGTSMRPLSASAVEGGGMRASGPRLKGPPVHIEKDTFKSKLPMQWAVAAAFPNSTAYVDAYGAPGRSRAASAGSSRPIRYRETTCPIGSVNPHTAIVPEHPVYPVPECYTSRPPFPQGPGDLTMETVHRASFAPRTAEQTARALKSAAEQTVAARTALHKSSVPLGPAALSLLEPAQWATEKAAKYVAHPIDVAANYAQAEAFKSALGGPTASTGRLTATVWRPAAADAAATASRAEQLGG